ncbi:DNA oxidative demethylase ALKBH2, partial [Elysia marginata]
MQGNIITKTKKQRELKRPCQKTEDKREASASKSMKITDYFTNGGEKSEQNDLPSSSSVKHTVRADCPSMKWRVIKGENLKLRYSLLYSKAEARGLLTRCEEELSYNTGNLAKVKIFGKLIDIPRKQ